MKTLLAATAALTALTLAPGAWAQSQYGSTSGSYGDAGYGAGGYGQTAPPYDRQSGGPSTQHYPTNGYPRFAPAGAPDDASAPPYDGQGAYGSDDDDMAPGDYSDDGYAPGGSDQDYRSGYPTDNGAYPGDWQNPPPPSSQGYRRRGAQGYGSPSEGGGPGPGQAYAPASIPSDLLQREDRLERRINDADGRGMAPRYATDNLMIVLNSIRDQQEELAQRDNGLNFTDRRFIESRLDRLEEQVRALR